MSVTNNRPKKGDCEACDKVDVMLYLEFGNIWMCADCRAEQQAIATSNSKAVIEASRKVDTQIELKQDVFNAATVSFVELQAAITANDEIPANRKDYALMEEVAARIDKLSKVIFEEEAALVAKRNERHALLINAQVVAAKLHISEREKFKQYDVNYKPVTKPVVKSPSKTPKAKWNKAEVVAACNKYPGVPMAQVQSLIVARNMNPEDAAKHMAGLLGLL